MGKIVNQAELAKIFDVSDETVRIWQAEGLPYQRGPVGLSNEYDTATVIMFLMFKAFCKRYGHPWPMMGDR